MKKNLLLFTLILFFSIKNLFGQPQWIWQNPSPAGNNFVDVYFVNDSIGTVLDYNGNIYRTTDGGITWMKQNSGVKNILNRVIFTSIDTGFIVGEDIILRTINSGSSWDIQYTSPNDIEEWKGFFLNLFFVNSQIGFAISDGNEILRTIDGGITWQPIPPISNYYQITTGTGIVAQSADTIIITAGDIYRTTNSGQTWERYTVNNVEPGEFFYLTNITYLNSTTLIAIGLYGAIARSIDNGVTWTKQSGKTDFFTVLRSVDFYDENNGIAVGTGGTFFQSSDGGLTWIRRDIGTTKDLEQVFFSSPYHGFIVGKQNSFFKTVDGVQWNNIMQGTTQTLLGIDFVNPSVGIAVGDNGTITKTVNGGSQWEIQNSGVTIPLRGVSLYDVDNGYVVGANGTILRTVNGGTIWTSQNSGTVNILYSVVTITPTIAIAVGQLGTILRTTDGQNWVTQTSGVMQELRAVGFANSTVGYVVGARGTILRTNDGGITWVKQISGTINNLYSISIIDEQIATVVGMDGIMLRTTNGGTTWQQQKVQIANSFGQLQDMNVYFYGISFTDTLHGIFIGEKGIICKTDNGGTPWYIDTTFLSSSDLYAIDFVSDTVGVIAGRFGNIIAYRPSQIQNPFTTKKFLNNISSHLDQNYPNPVNPTTSIGFRIAKSGFVTLKVYDVLGKEIAMLVNEKKASGNYTVSFDASLYSSGIYFYRLYIDGTVQTKKMIVVK